MRVYIISLTGLCLTAFIALLIFVGGDASAQERVCPDGKRPYFGVCPTDGNNKSRPSPPSATTSQPDRPSLPSPLKSFKDCDTCPEMVSIPPGSFLMGSPDGEGLPTERPQRRVSVGGFAIGRYEVTQTEWEAVMKTTPSKYPGALRPVEKVTWAEAQEYVKKLSLKTGRDYRLPTEAQWEYAARAGSRGRFHFGDVDMINEFSFVRSSVTQSVGQKRPNDYGLHDMYGNVWEFTLDCWTENYIGAPTDGTPHRFGDCKLSVLRGCGGTFGESLPKNYVFEMCNSVGRGSAPKDQASVNVGLRVVRAD